MIRVGVLRGGTGNEYSKSLETGAYVLKHLPRDTFEVLDIFLDRDGVWHLSGRPLSHEKLKMRVDVIWNALHGFYGEDGKVQQLLESLGIPYTGSGALSSAIAMNKKLSKGHLVKAGIKTPRGVYIESWGDADHDEAVAEVVAAVAAKFSPPWIVEPISRGQGLGAFRAKTRGELGEILSEMSRNDIPVLIEEAVLGKEVSMIATKGLRKKELYTFLPIEKGNTRARFQKPESEKLQKIARDVHHALGLGSYVRVNAVVTKKGDIHVLSVETLPALSGSSDLHQAFDTVGVSFSEFAEALIGEALKRK